MNNSQVYKAAIKYITDNGGSTLFGLSEMVFKAINVYLTAKSITSSRSLSGDIILACRKYLTDNSVTFAVNTDIDVLMYLVAKKYLESKSQTVQGTGTTTVNQAIDYFAANGAGVSVPAYWYNYNPANLTAAKSVKTTFLAGTTRMVVGIMGDSTTAGQGAGVIGVSSVKCDGAFNLCTTAAMQTSLIGRGVQATKAEWGGHGVPANGGSTAQQAINAYNPRVNYGNWSPGSDFSQKAVDNGPWTYTPAVGELIDTVEWMDLGTGGQTWSVTINGVAPSVTSSVTSYSDTRRRTYSAAAPTSGAFAISLTGGTGYFYGARAWNSTVNAVDLLNYGVLGYQASQFKDSTGTFGHIDQMINTGMKLVYVNLGLNDVFFTSNPVTDSVSYGNNIENYIAIFQAQGITVVPVFPPRRADVSQATTELFRAEARRAAINKNCVLIDLYQKFGVDGGTTGSNAAYYDDDVHMNSVGYNLIGIEYADFWAAI